MMPLENNHHTAHFHIRWPNKLDWERFDSEQEAEVRAGELARPGENFQIETFNSDCPMCRELQDMVARD